MYNEWNYENNMYAALRTIRIARSGSRATDNDANFRM